MEEQNVVIADLAPAPVSARVARSLVEGSARQLNCLSDTEIDDLCVAVGEAFSNVVRHGKTEDNEAVHLFVERLPESLAVHLHYPTDPFDTCPSVPSPDVMATGGYGLFLMRSLTDVVDFEFQEGRAHLCLEKKCIPLRP